MGIYGNLAHQIMNEDNTIAIEIFVCSELYNQLISESNDQLSILQENLKADIVLKDNKKSIKVTVRDARTMSRGGDKGQHNCSIKIVEPTSIVKNGIDIVVPGFTKSGDAPYPGAKVPGKLTPEEAYVDKNAESKVKKGKTYPDEVLLALKFANEYKKQLNLIFNKPDNEANQMKLLEEILTKCDYISDFKVGSEKDTNEMREKVNKKRSNKI